MSIIDKVNGILENVSSENKTTTSINDIVDSKLSTVLKTLSGTVTEDISTANGTKNLDDRINERLIDNVVSFIGASGGVGTTTTVVNVAYNLKKMGKSVIIIDMDILNPSVKDYFESTMHKTPNKDLVSFLTGSSILGECIYSTQNKIALMSAYNRNIADYVYMDSSSVAEGLSKMIYQLKGLFDVVLIDIPGKLLMSDIVGQALYDSSHIYMVWDENISCISGTETLKINMQKIGIAHETKMKRIVFNCRTAIDYPKYPIQKSGLKLATILPYDAGIKESALRAEVFIENGMSKSKFAEAYCQNINELASIILNDCKGSSIKDTDIEEGGSI